MTGEAFRERSTRLIAIAVRQCHMQPQVAAELVQVVLTRFLSGKYAPDHEQAWLAKAVVRECVSYNERLARREIYVGASCDLPHAVHDPRAQVDAEILVNELVTGLESRSAEVLHLHYIQGFTAREIAEKLDTSESYAENLISKGLREAKEFLEGRREGR